MSGERRVMVCASCLRAGCWHGEVMCDEARGAGTVEKPAHELDALNLEHPDNYSRARIRAIYGTEARL